jgi:hypothetical protein
MSVCECVHPYVVNFTINFLLHEVIQFLHFLTYAFCDTNMAVVRTSDMGVIIPSFNIGLRIFVW